MAKHEHHITDAASGTALAVRIEPGAHCDEVATIGADGAVEIRLAVPEAESDTALVNFLAELLSANPRDIEILVGRDSRKKLVTIMNVNAVEVERLLLEAAAQPGC